MRLTKSLTRVMKGRAGLVDKIQSVERCIIHFGQFVMRLGLNFPLKTPYLYPGFTP